MGWSTRTTGTATSFLRITADRAHHVSEENEMRVANLHTHRVMWSSKNIIVFPVKG